MDWKLKAFARKEDYSYNAKKRGKYTFSGQFLRGGVKAHVGDCTNSKVELQISANLSGFLIKLKKTGIELVNLKSS